MCEFGKLKFRRWDVDAPGNKHLKANIKRENWLKAKAQEEEALRQKKRQAFEDLCRDDGSMHRSFF